MVNITKKIASESSNKNFINVGLLARFISSLLLVSPFMFSQPVTASPNQTRIAARMACMKTSKTMIMHPDYYGQTRSGLDIWICAETGSGSQVFSMFDPGPNGTKLR